MSAPSSPTVAPGAGASPAGRPVPVAEIDASLRWPVLLLFVSAVLWLVFGTILALIASIKLHGPGFLNGSAWLTYGRINPAAMNALLYGFASQAGLGVALWLLCRLGRVGACCQAPLIIAGVFWNLGVAAGIPGILAGDSTGFQWLEMPRYASPILFAAYSLIGLCAIFTFHARRERPLYVSQWYLLAALFWFPWIYSAANYLLVFRPARGVMQAVVNAWFTNNFLGLWLAPIGLGAIFYFVPKLTGRPLHSRPLAAFGFWTLAFFTNWTGLTQLIGGPLPAWLPAASQAANGLMIVPILCAGMNWFLTLQTTDTQNQEHLTLRLVRLGATCYLAWGLMSIFTGLRAVSEVTHFTYVTVAQNYLALLGFLALTFFGCFYYIVPRLTQVAWPSEKLARWHVTCSTVAIAVIVIALTIAGLWQGAKLNKSTADFIALTRATLPWGGLFTLGLLLFLAGQLLFLRNLFLLLRVYGEPCRQTAIGFFTGAEALEAGRQP